MRGNEKGRSWWQACPYGGGAGAQRGSTKGGARQLKSSQTNQSIIA